MTARVSIIVPNWNGEAFLARCLAAAIQSARSASLDSEIIVVDDKSSDRSCEIVQHDFPSIRLLRNETNVGFGETANRGASESQGEILVFLNNDLVSKQQMLAQLVEPLLSQADVFGVTGKTVNWQNEEPNHVRMNARWRGGGFELLHENAPEICETMFLQGGSCAVRRREFLEFGGFASLFSPGYWEDYDISYLALKAGWRNLYNPNAEGYHLGQGSMRRAHGPFVDVLKQRNAFLFTWLNVTDEKLLREHLTRLPGRLASALGSRNRRINELRGFVRAIQASGAVAKQRKHRMQFVKRSDASILQQFQDAGQPA